MNLKPGEHGIVTVIFPTRPADVNGPAEQIEVQATARRIANTVLVNYYKLPGDGAFTRRYGQWLLTRSRSWDTPRLKESE